MCSRPPVEWVPPVLSPGLKRPGLETDHLCPGTEVKISGGLPFLFLTTSHFQLFLSKCSFLFVSMTNIFNAFLIVNSVTRSVHLVLVSVNTVLISEGCQSRTCSLCGLYSVYLF